MQPRVRHSDVHKQQLTITPGADCTWSHPSVIGDGVTHHHLFYFIANRCQSGIEHSTHLWFGRKGESPIP